MARTQISPSLITTTGPSAIVPSGTILDFGGATAPSGWTECDGSAISRTTFSALFAAIGTIWGIGDGSTTFNVPDLRRRTCVGRGGAGSGTLANTIGSIGGEEAHAQTVSELATHGHSLTDPGHNHTQNAHNHGVTDPGHSHTVNDPTHNHTQNSHGHGVTDPGHTHTATMGDGSASNGHFARSPATNGTNATTNSSTTGLSVSANTATNNATSTGISNNSNTTGISTNNATPTNNSNTTGISIGNNGSGTGANVIQPSAVVIKIIKN